MALSGRLERAPTGVGLVESAAPSMQPIQIRSNLLDLRHIALNGCCGFINRLELSRRVRPISVNEFRLRQPARYLDELWLLLGASSADLAAPLT